MKRTTAQTAAEYLSALSRELRGAVSEPKRELLVSEQALWLEHRINDEVILGAPCEEAERRIVTRNGDPKILAKKLAFESYEDEVNSPVYNALGRANVTANSVFGLMCGLYMCFIQIGNALPSGQPLKLGLSPAQVRQVFPSPLPYPDLTWQFLAHLAFALIAPIVGGWICGRLIPVCAPRAVYHIVMIMALGCFLMGLMLLPQTTALVFAVLLTIYWLPVGCLTAHLSSSMLRWKRRRALERNGWIPSSPHIKETYSQ